MLQNCESCANSWYCSPDAMMKKCPLCRAPRRFSLHDFLKVLSEICSKEPDDQDHDQVQGSDEENQAGNA